MAHAIQPIRPIQPWPGDSPHLARLSAAEMDQAWRELAEAQHDHRHHCPGCTDCLPEEGDDE